MMDVDNVKAAYRRYAPVYDQVFGMVFSPGRESIVEALRCKPGDRILEVGVGTGMSLPLYPPEVRVTGIDLSGDMLERARRRVADHGLTQVEALIEMDGEDMDFPSESFDKVVAMYVVSVSPNPIRLIDEMRRVCKRDGDLFIVNHFCSKNMLLRGVERVLSPLSSLAGFRPNVDLDDLLEKTGMDVQSVMPVNLFGYWKMLHGRNTASRTNDAMARASCLEQA